MTWIDGAKRRAAAKAVEHVKDGMILGFGSGSTAAEAIRILGKKLENGDITDITGVPTSFQSSQEAVRAGIPLTTLDEHSTLDLGIDGADQIDLHLNAIKGGGGALLREKIVATSCKEYILIIDSRKLVKVLGESQPVYLEVHPFAAIPTSQKIVKIGAEVKIRQAKGKLGPVITDNGNFILDAIFGPIVNPKKLDIRLHSIPGVLETGLFIGIADTVYIGKETSVEKIVSK